MKGPARRRPLRAIGEINMTPLIDLTFILLITFIITFPLIEQGVPVNLPAGRAEPLDSSDVAILSVDREGRIFLDREPVTEEALASFMAARVADDPDAPVYIRGDEALNYGRIVEVLRLLKKARVRRMALVTREEQDGEP